MNQPLLRSVPILETERLVLKEIYQTDAPNLYQLFTDEQVIKTFGFRMGHSMTEAHNIIAMWRKMLDTGDGIRWGMYLKPSMKLIGNLGFKNITSSGHVNVGYALLPLYWRKGFMSEALPAIISHAFNQMNVHKIEATVLTINTSSLKLLKKLGFVRTASLPKHYFFEKDFHDVYVYNIESSNRMYRKV